MFGFAKKRPLNDEQIWSFTMILAGRITGEEAAKRGRLAARLTSKEVERKSILSLQRIEEIFQQIWQILAKSEKVYLTPETKSQIIVGAIALTGTTFVYALMRRWAADGMQHYRPRWPNNISITASDIATAKVIVEAKSEPDPVYALWRANGGPPPWVTHKTPLGETR
jgi:hypothetical protein